MQVTRAAMFIVALGFGIWFVSTTSLLVTQPSPPAYSYSQVGWLKREYLMLTGPLLEVFTVKEREASVNTSNPPLVSSDTHLAPVQAPI